MKINYKYYVYCFIIIASISLSSCNKSLPYGVVNEPTNKLIDSTFNGEEKNVLLKVYSRIKARHSFVFSNIKYNKNKNAVVIEFDPAVEPDIDILRELLKIGSLKKIINFSTISISNDELNSIKRNDLKIYCIDDAKRLHLLRRPFIGTWSLEEARK